MSTETPPGRPLTQPVDPAADHPVEQTVGTRGDRTPPPAPTGHPKGFWFIFCGELAERASFYGMKAVLTLYLVHVFAYPRDRADDLYHTFVAACYFTPLIGGLIADRFLGKYWTIVLFAVPYLIGQFLVGLSDEGLMVGALGLLAFGSGVIKPNISTLMGLTYDQKRPGNEQLRTQAFMWFYVAINVGSFLSTLICPWLRDTFGKSELVNGKPVPTDPQAGYLAAFLFPGILMAVALTIFALGKKWYAVEVIDRTPATPEQKAARWKIISQIAGLFTLVTFFWAIFDQHGSTWIHFAEDHLDLNVMGYTIAPDSIQAINPLLIVLFVPLMARLYAFLIKKGYDLRPTNKMLVGFLLTALCMAIHAGAAYASQNADGTITRVTILWQVLAFVVITIAEILISITGLELAFAAAPQSMKGFVTSLWLLTVGMANLIIDKPVTQMYPGEGDPAIRFLKWKLIDLPGWVKFDNAGDYFSFLTAAGLVVALAFVFVARNFNRTQATAGKVV